MTRRIAFVNLQLGESLLGLTRAITGQARAAQECNLPIDFWIINREREGSENGIHYARFVPSRLGERATRLFRARALARVSALEEYDFVFLRYPMALDLDPLAFFKARQRRIVTVHHSKEVEEILSWGRTPGSYARAWFERLNSPRILSRVDGVVGVTDEIRRYELRRGRSSGPSKTISNGIDVSRVPLSGHVPFDGQELKLLFIASSHAPWHGTERLLASVKRYRGPVRILLHMVGQAANSEATKEELHGPLRIIHHGTLQGEALENVFRDANLAISSLTMFKVGLRQGCVLKTREYLARGLPFVYGYDDVDLTDDLPFCRSVGGHAEPFDVEELIQLASRLRDLPDISGQMRSWAESHIDWRVKMRMYHAFAKELEPSIA